MARQMPMHKVMSDPIVLTGCGWVTPHVSGTIADVLAAYAQRGPLSSAKDYYWPIPESTLAEFGLAIELKREKCAWMPAIALELALRDASLAAGSLPPERTGMILGCALAGQLGMIQFAGEVRAQGTRFVSPIHFPQTVGNYTAGALARAYQLRGTNLTLAAGLASSLNAITEACGLLAGGEVDVVLAGGFEELTPELARELSADLPQGSVLAEGACLFVLERLSRAMSRGITPLATIQPETTVTEPEGQRVLSAAGRAAPGGVFIERWTGRCPGAAGAAAMAAGIGAARCLPVPLHPMTTSGHRKFDAGPQCANGSVPALVRVESEDDRVDTVVLSVQPPKLT